MNQIAKLAQAGTPFRLNVAPGQAFAHPAWRLARATALDHLRQGRPVALLGLPGTGKTLLLQDLAAALREEGFPVRVVDRGDALKPGAANDILLVDEAGAMETEALGSLCARAAPCVLAALPSFSERLAELDCALAPVTLEPLSPAEVAQYVAANLAAANQPKDLLEPDAISALARHSRGLLRVVNALGGAAMFLARMEGAARVAQRHVNEAHLMRHGPAEQATMPAPAAEPLPAEPDPVEPPAAEPVPVEPVPVEPAPVEPVLVEPFPAKPLPAEPVPVEPPAAEAVAEPAAAPAPEGPAREGRPAAVLPKPGRPPLPATLHVAASERLVPTPPAAMLRRAARRRRAQRLAAIAAVLTLGLAGAVALLKPEPARDVVAQLPVEEAPAIPPAEPVPVPEPSLPLPPVPAETPLRASRSTPAPRSEPAPRGDSAPRSEPTPRSEPAPPRLGRPGAAPGWPSEGAAPALPSTGSPSGKEGWQRDLLTGVLTYRGGVYNETIQQGGRLVLSVRRLGPPGAVSVRFDASNGLIGAGELTGYLSEDGRLTASGTLQMRQVPFDCELSGVVTGTGLSGTATFLRSDDQGGRARTRSSFNLSRS